MRGVFYLIRPLSGVSCLSFYRPRGSRDYRWEKKNQREMRSFKDAGSSFSSERVPLTQQIVPGIACPLILIGPCSGFVQQVVTSHPAPTDGAMDQGVDLRPYGEQTAQ